MRVATFAEIEPEFVERAHRMVWCDLATVGSDGRPRTRVVHPIWQGPVAYVTSLRVGPKADDIARNPYVSLAYVCDHLKPAYAECVADWIDDPETRRQFWELTATVPEPLGYDTEAMFGSYDFPHLSIMRLKPWRVRLEVAGDQAALRVWQE
ncbi:MAG: pyridoxamine 5'-phosphate oxidase [Chloroflexota bacterium]|nr:pyridoxamine 5'-phosphate oxidase [Chloroflexota bacterium]